MNNLDPRQYNNPLAGCTAKPGGTKNKLCKPAPWFSAPKAPLAAEAGRLGLVYRSLEDGKNLIETSNAVIKDIEKLQ